MFHTPAYKQTDPTKQSGSVIGTELGHKRTFMEWWRQDGYKIHVSDANSFTFASKVWAAAQHNKV